MTEEMELGMEKLTLIPQDELEKTILLVEKRERFQEVKQFIKNGYGEEAEFTERIGLQFEIQDMDIHSELLILNDPINFISLLYSYSKNVDGLVNYEQTHLQVVLSENNETVIKSYRYDQDIKQLEAYDTETVDGDLEAAWALINKRNNEGLLEDIDKNPEAYDGTINPQGFGDFCLPGGYHYCGKKCGSCKGCTAGGGGALKNKVDGCCLLHDDCYAKNKTDRCNKCDRTLVNCVLNPINYKTGPVAAESIITFFFSKCLFA